MEDASLEGPVRGGVVSEGDGAAYALVWEWGNARQTKQGPKTVRGTNPDGEEVWLSIQAPEGYIRISEPVYIAILQEKLAGINFSDISNGSAIRKEILKASQEAAIEIAEIIKENAPEDTGQLKNSIKPAKPNDEDLELDDEELELGIGFKHFRNKPKK